MRTTISNLHADAVRHIGSMASLRNARALSLASSDLRGALRDDLARRATSLHSWRVGQYVNAIRSAAKFAVAQYPMEGMRTRTVHAGPVKSYAEVYVDHTPRGMHARLFFSFSHPDGPRLGYNVSLVTARGGLSAKAPTWSSDHAKNFKQHDKHFHRLALKILRAAIALYNKTPEKSRDARFV